MQRPPTNQKLACTSLNNKKPQSREAKSLIWPETVVAIGETYVEQASNRKLLATPTRQHKVSTRKNDTEFAKGFVAIAIGSSAERTKANKKGRATRLL
mmetsp:Transcript_14195/g.26778  ORF Transcript_14195/g.26778 Transcript_14195/m.26778 type:complete len:98 (-) Transcript_14195:1032-1325(-)